MATTNRNLLRRVDLRGFEGRLQDVLPRPSAADLAEAESAARRILDDVRGRGDAAVLEYTRRFDCPTLPADRFRVADDEVAAAYERVSPEWLAAARAAIANVRAYHERERPESWQDDFDGLLLGQRMVPIERVGIYAPAGKAPLPSSLIMAAVPAHVAGVSRIVVCAPPGREGNIAPVILVAARECEVGEVFRIGGAQAIAAMAYGTETVPKVDLIAGPGNAFVVAAKRLVFGEVGIESLPGPSETCVVADAQADPALVAADLLSQAEHGPDSPAFLVTDSEALIGQVEAELAGQLSDLERGAQAQQSLADYGAAVLVRDLGQAAEAVNAIAPEHCQVMTADSEAVAGAIRHAGCLFIGPWSPVPLGDYIAGPSHVLPTNRTARFSSPLSVHTFLKRMSVIQASPDGLARLADHCMALAEAEGLTAHAAAVRRRLGR